MNKSFRPSQRLPTRRLTRIYRPENLNTAERAIRSAFSLSRTPSGEMYEVLAEILESQSKELEARTAYGKAYELAKSSHNASLTTDAIRGLIRTNSDPQHRSESERWFSQLVQNRWVNFYDWVSRAQRLEGMK